MKFGSAGRAQDILRLRLSFCIRNDMLEKYIEVIDLLEMQRKDDDPPSFLGGGRTIVSKRMKQTVNN